jgi:hypothetical protein
MNDQKKLITIIKKNEGNTQYYIWTYQLRHLQDDVMHRLTSSCFGRSRCRSCVKIIVLSLSLARVPMRDY